MSWPLILLVAAVLPVIVGILIGDRLHHRLDPRAFRRAVGVLLIGSGLGLLFL